MAIRTTVIEATTVATALISSATTWASIIHGRVDDPVPFSAFNDGTIRVRIGGSDLSSASPGTGFPLMSSGTFSAQLAHTDAVFVVTTASTSSIVCIAGRQ